MAVTIFNHGGGGKQLAIKIVGGTVQPTGVAGLLWVNTATAISKWTFAVAQPSSYALGDIWIQMDAVSANLISLLKKDSTVAKVNVLRVKQYNGTNWAFMAAHYHNGTSWTQISNTFSPYTDISYTGTKTVIDDGAGHWRVKFLTSGILTFAANPGEIDIFLVGSGASGMKGNYVNAQRAGGNSGRTTTAKQLSVVVSTQYTISIGAGGNGAGAGIDTSIAGGNTTALGYTALGGEGRNLASSYGGSGGAGHNGTAGTNGGNGTGDYYGIGQGTTTREFGDSSGTLYATGGIAGGSANGTDNTGNGGNGGNTSNNTAGNGASGVVVMRDHRAA